jgi:hypothetical protein
MTRKLTVSRVTVNPRSEPEYLATLGQLAARRQSRGQSFWLFRHPTESDTFLEFSEGGSPPAEGSAGDEAEALLEARLRVLAAYAPDAEVLWQEVPLPPG